jgi:hypothetical protein
MNKLIVALCASAFAFGSASALAGNDMKPLSKMETQEAKAARAAAKAKWDKMTPEEQAAYKKQARAKKQSEQTALEAVAQESDRYNTKQGAADAAASKELPKPTKEQRAKDLSTLEKTGQDNSMQPLPPTPKKQ